MAMAHCAFYIYLLVWFLSVFGNVLFFIPSSVSRKTENTLMFI